MQRETPAVTTVVRTVPGKIDRIHSCPEHVTATVRQLSEDPVLVPAAFRSAAENITLVPADPSIHGCKGCWDDWPP
jgi:hypothetical protein